MGEIVNDLAVVLVTEFGETKSDVPGALDRCSIIDLPEHVAER
jgi:hypothetical protein